MEELVENHDKWKYVIYSTYFCCGNKQGKLRFCCFFLKKKEP